MFKTINLSQWKILNPIMNPSIFGYFSTVPPSPLWSISASRATLLHSMTCSIITKNSELHFIVTHIHSPAAAIMN